ncbi:DUF4843 domain-containing protein [Chitinophaga filiformis]|uniref:DUF4843 domain-containing protein n=1 Tax=Chitinophaga filiformis TaxID=104663 RepID=UPI001F328C86|nr:DUF4843 domain-containing protein [Chitinophaga filiformis]MCF6404651.1 DUF4843 domain-containing protein [Chitinophaga filiformis]
MKGFYIAAILYFALLGCKKETIDLYSGKSLLYFDYSLHTSNQRNPERIDTALFTFSLANEQLTDSTFNVQVSLMGKQADHDRAINIQVVDSATTAIAGVHYEPLATTFVLPANQSVVYIPVHIYRTAEMSQQQYRLQLQLQPNQDFDTTIAQIESKKDVSTSTFTLYIDDQIGRPARWLDGYLGTFSRKKILLICSQLNMTVNDFTAITVAEVTYIGKAMQRYLDQQKASGNSVYEDDGTEMSMGTLSQ